MMDLHDIMGLQTWKWVPGFEGRYEVSDLGRVRSHHFGRIKNLRPGRTASGHLTVCLGRGNSQYVHRIVLLAFVGPPKLGQEALHWNDTPNDNRLSNLRWGTRSDNLKDSIRNGIWTLERFDAPA